MARITTLIPTYRRPALLRRALNSVLAQTFTDFEVQVWDNASGDSTHAVVEEFMRRDSRVRYLCHPENVGMSPNHRIAAESVKTPLFNFLSDDDMLLPEFFATAVKALERNPAAQFFIGLLLFANDDGAALMAPLFPWRSGLYPPSALTRLANAQTWMSMMFRSNVYSEVGGFDQRLDNAGDVDFLLRVLVKYSCVIDKTPCAVFSLHSGSNSTAGPRVNLARDVLLTIGNVQRSSSIAAGVQKRIVEDLTRSYIRLGLEAADLGQREAVMEVSRDLSGTLDRPIVGMLMRVMAGRSISSALLKTTFRTLEGLRNRRR
ncbi:MAG: glycosyltransferase family 2 protein, partial [Candidatus Binataceae bacterium]